VAHGTAAGSDPTPPLAPGAGDYWFKSMYGKQCLEGGMLLKVRVASCQGQQPSAPPPPSPRRPPRPPSAR
jgi:hypothetical protein